MHKAERGDEVPMVTWHHSRYAIQVPFLDVKSATTAQAATTSPGGIVQAGSGLKVSLRVSLRSSWTLAIVLALAHGAAAVVVSLAEPPIWLQLGLFPVLLFSCVSSIQGKALLRGQSSVIALEVDAGNELSVKTLDGQWHQCVVLGTSFVAHYLAVLNLRDSGTRRIRHVVILADALHEEDFRRLRVWLRWREESASSA